MRPSGSDQQGDPQMYIATTHRHTHANHRCYNDLHAPSTARRHCLVAPCVAPHRPLRSVKRDTSCDLIAPHLSLGQISPRILTACFSKVFAGFPQRAKSFSRCLRGSRKGQKVFRGACGAPAKGEKFFEVLAGFPQRAKSFSRRLRGSRKGRKVFRGACGAPAKGEKFFEALAGFPQRAKSFSRRLRSSRKRFLF